MGTYITEHYISINFAAVVRMMDFFQCGKTRCSVRAPGSRTRLLAVRCVIGVAHHDTGICALTYQCMSSDRELMVDAVLSLIRGNDFEIFFGVFENFSSVVSYFYT
jgi:hypothetical protein